MQDRRLHLPAGATAGGPWTVELTPERAGWRFSGLRVIELAAGQTHEFATGGEEMIALPLAGSCAIDCDGEHFELAGRADVFTSVSDFAYLPIHSEVRMRSQAGGRFALPSARAQRRRPAAYRDAAQVPVELRGAGACSRQVNNFAAADVFDAEALIAVEVLTPGGNWSSFPPHKHDTQGPAETMLEEVYYFEFAPRAGGRTPTGGDGRLGYHRVYGSEAGPIDVLAEVRQGDVVLVPHGWHGPSIATPGCHMYYLNVMAGPAERAWRFSVDPAYGWVVDEWARQSVDPRLPLTSEVERS